VDTILILDDDAATLHSIAEVLRFEYYSILEASTGLQAIETGRQCGQLSLLVSAIEAPDLSDTTLGQPQCRTDRALRCRSRAGKLIVLSKGAPVLRGGANLDNPVSHAGSTIAGGMAALHSCLLPRASQRSRL